MTNGKMQLKLLKKKKISKFNETKQIKRKWNKFRYWKEKKKNKNK